MVSEQRHQMQLEVTHPSGAEEWACPECGRRFIAEWEPRFRRVILKHGQDQVIHVGHGMGFLGTSIDAVAGENATTDSSVQDVWKKYLDTLDLDLDDHNDPSISP
jgi:hypothetical protein